MRKQVHFPYAPSQTPRWTHICFDNSFKISIAKNSLKICNLNSSTVIIWPNSINIANLSRIEHYIIINQPIHKTYINLHLHIHVIILTPDSISPYSNKGLQSLQTGHMMQDCEWCRKNMDGSGKHRRNPAVNESDRSRAHRQSWLIIYFPLPQRHRLH